MKDLQTLIPDYLGRLFATWVAPKWLIAGALALLEYVAPGTAPNVLLASCALVVMDTLTGLVRAKVTLVPVTSAKLTRFLTKSFTYAAAVVTVALACDSVPETHSLHAGVVTAMLTGISITEIKSIFENLHALRPDLWGVIAEAITRGFAKPGGPK